MRRHRLKEHARALLFLDAVRPKPTGPHGIGRRTVPVASPFPDGELAVDLWYPADRDNGLAGRLAAMLFTIAHPTRAYAPNDVPFSTDAGAVPLVLQFPSWFSVRTESTYTPANLASHGFIVAAFDDIVHLAPLPGQDGEAQAGGLDMTSDAAFAASRVVAARRVALAAEAGKAVVDGLLRRPDVGVHIDAACLGALGFSFGGGAAAALSLLDPRIKAVVNLDGSLFGDASRLGVAVPYLNIFSTDPPFPTPADLAQPNIRKRLDALLVAEAIEHQRRHDGRPDRWTFVVDATRHTDFCDRLVMPAFYEWRRRRTIDRAQTWSDINAYLVAFFDRTLRGRDPALLRMAPPFHGIRSLEAQGVANPPVGRG